MAKNFQLKIVSPAKVVFDGSVESLIVPGVAGYLGILADHAPLISTLKVGKITIRDASGQEKIIPCANKGFLEVLKNQVTILLQNQRLRAEAQG